VLDRARRALLADRGYAHVRTFHRMVLAPDAPVAPPVVPVGVALRPIDPTADAPSVHALLREAFAEHGLLGVPEDHAIWRHLTLDEPRWVPGPSQVAVADGAIVGAVLGFPEEEQGWIRHLGVSGAQRGRGLGAALLSAAFLAFRELGLPQVGLGVDSANRSGATRLYERVGMRVASEVELLERRLPI
jgi:ribosomal protein S18 acetylase RimI-like enzyme